MGDLLDAPGGRAEGDHIIDPRLVHHFLVQFADAARAGALFAFGQHHAEHAAVGDGAAAGDRQLLGARARAQFTGVPVPDQARAKASEVIGGIAPGEHVQGGIERAARQRAVRRGTAHAGIPGVHVQRVHRRCGDGLLGQHVQRIAGRVHRLDAAGQHAFDGDRRVDQVAPRAWVDQAGGNAADLVAGAPHPLQRAGHRGRRGDLDDQVDQAHVDAQFQAGGGHHAAQFARLQGLLDVAALLLGDRAMVRTRDQRRCAGGAPAGAAVEGSVVRCGVGTLRRRCRRGVQRRIACQALCVHLVEARGEFLGHATRVGEHDGGAPLQDLVQDAAFHVGPDGAYPAGFVAGARGNVGHVLHGHHDPHVQLACRGRIDHGDGAIATEEGGHLFHRPHRGRQPDPLRRLRQQGVQALQAQRQVAAALGAGHRVDFIDDHAVYAAQRLACLRGEHQEQRFRRGDQDVRRPPHQPGAFGSRGIPAPDADREVQRRVAASLACGVDALQGNLQVAMHVGTECLDR